MGMVFSSSWEYLKIFLGYTAETAHTHAREDCFDGVR